MTNKSPEYFDGAAPEGLSLIARLKAGLSTAIGAVVALGIIFAMGVWFYRLGDRDARNVPIIRADASPVKRIPDDPGGAKTPHQDITSYSAGDGGAVTAGAAVIAPEPPEPKRDDLAMGKLKVPEEKAAPAEADPVGKTMVPDAAAAPEEAVTAPVRPRTESTVPTAAEAPVDEAPAGVTLPEDTPADGTRVAMAPATAATAPTRPEVAEPAPEPEAETEAETTVPDEEFLIPGSTEFAPDSSPTAPRRPGDLIARNEAAGKSAETAKTDLIADAATSPFQVQLAADPDRSIVVRLWKRIQNANKDILRDRALAVQTTVSGGTKYFRLRVGPFATRAEAASVCQALKARKQDCIVARNS